MNKKSFGIFIAAFFLGILIGRFGSSVVKFLNNPITEKPRTMKTVNELTALRNDLESYKKSCGRYPSSLADLPSGADGNSSCGSRGQDAKAKPDAWGNNYLYQGSDSSFQVISCGNSWLEIKSNEVAKTVEERE